MHINKSYKHLKQCIVKWLKYNHLQILFLKLLENNKMMLLIY